MIPRALEYAFVALVVAVLLVHEKDEWVAEQVSVEIRAIERYMDEKRPVLEHALALGQLAQVLCADYFAGSQIVRVQDELREEGLETAEVCR